MEIIALVVLFLWINNVSSDVIKLKKLCSSQAAEIKRLRGNK